MAAANSQGWHGRRASSHKGYSIDAPISKVFLSIDAPIYKVFLSIDAPISKVILKTLTKCHEPSLLFTSLTILISLDLIIR